MVHTEHIAYAPMILLVEGLALLVLVAIAIWMRRNGDPRLPGIRRRSPDALARSAGNIEPAPEATEGSLWKWTQAALRENQEEILAMFEVSSIGMAQADPRTGRWLRANKKMCAITGYSAEQLLDLRVLEITHPEDRQRDWECFQRVVSGEIPDYKLEERYICKDGRIAWVNVNMTVLRDPAGIPTRTIATIEDITERRQAEDELRKLSRAVEQSPASIVITNPAGDIEYVNAKFTSVTGYTFDEVRGRNPRILKSGDMSPELYQELWQTIRGGREWRGELRNKGKDGRLFWESASISPILDESGRIAHLLAVKEDITERKRAEEELRASQQIIEGIINAIPVRVFWKDKNLVFLGCNLTFARDAGFDDPKDLIGKNDYQMSWQAQADLYRADDRQVIESGCPKLLVEEPQTTSEGNTSTILTTKTPLRNGQGEITGVLGTYMDVTERKRADERLAHLHQQNELILTSVSEGILGLDKQGNHTFVNPAAARMLGYSVEELLGRPGHATWHHTRPDGTGYPANECTISSVYKDGKASQASADLFWRKDGSSFPVEYVSAPIREHGRVVGEVITFSDITTRKQSEQALQQSEQRFRALIENNSDLISILEADGTIRYESPSITRMLGYDPAELIGRNAFELAHPDDRLEIESAFMDGVQEASRLQIREFRYRHKDGSWRYLSAIGRNLLEDESVKGFVVTARDVTQGRETEQQLRLLGDALDAAANSVVITDPRGCVVWTNPAFTRLTGFDRNEASGKTMQFLKSGRQDPGFYRQLWETITAGHVWCGELVNKRKDGSCYQERMTITPVGMATGAITHFVAIKEDITARRDMEIQLRHAQKMESIGQLAAGIAHEINTPTQYIGDNNRFLQSAFIDLGRALADLQRILAAARAGSIPDEMLDQAEEVLRDVDVGYLMEEIPAALAQSLEGVGRVSKIVGAMKEFSHPSGEEKAPADLNRAIESTITVCRNEWKYVADVETDLDPDLPAFPCLIGDLNQVVLNLIVNAAHAIAEREDQKKKGTIAVSTRGDGAWVELRVTDTGRGIPPDVRDRMFTPFFTTKPVGKGTGQGLAIARSVVVDKHGGTIRFESEVDEGTTFIVRLPIAPGSEQSDRALAA